MLKAMCQKELVADIKGGLIWLVFVKIYIHTFLSCYHFFRLMDDLS